MTKIEVILFFVMLTVYSFFVQYPNVNQNTRFDLTRAIVEERTVSIDRYHENTVDKSYVAGRWYTDKAPGVSLLAVPVYALLLQLQPVSDPRVWLGYPLYVVNALVGALPGALLVLLVFRWLLTVKGSASHALATAVAFGLGTLILPFATLFFGHVTSAFFAFAAFYAAWLAGRPSPDSPANQRRQVLLLLASGAAAGVAVLIEYSNGAVALLLALYCWTVVATKRNLFFYVLGLLPALCVLAVYNAIAFGDPFTLSYLHAPIVNEQNLAGVRRLTLTGLWAVTIGPRGLFTLSPLLLLAGPGFVAMWRRRDLRREVSLFALIAVGFCLLAWHYYDQLGSSPGPRYLITCLPFVGAAVGFALPRWKGPFLVFAAVSVVIMLAVTATNPAAPKSIANPIADYWLPAILQRSIVPTTVFLRFGMRSVVSLLFLAAVLAVGAVAWLAWLKLAPPVQERILTICAVCAVIGYLVMGLPIDPLHPFTVPQAVVGAVP